MAADKLQSFKGMTTRQKVTAGIVVLVLLIVIWQVYGMFKSEAPAVAATPIVPAKSMMASPPSTAGTATSTAAMPPGAPVQQQGPLQPKPAAVPAIQPTSPQEAELMRLQQETQTKYITAVNELQILKVSKDIATANRDISAAKLAQVTAEKKIIDLLTPPPPPPATDVLAKSAAATSALGDLNVQYSVVSVTQLQYRWGAILGYKGSLFNVHVGDVLPPDGSRVVAIARDGVTLEKDGARKKVFLVPTI